jgi:hypothetical protein
MILGLIWAGIGLVYLACVTKSFRNPVPQGKRSAAGQKI